MLTSLFAPLTATQPSAASVISERVEKALYQLKASSAPVIVSKNDPADLSLERKITKAGGSIDKNLPIINGFSATVPSHIIPGLGTHPNLRSMSLNRIGKFETISYDEASVASSGPKTTGATKLWAQGNYGKGVGVAVIDTGISPMNDFNAKGVRLVHGPDLSGENSVIDTYGHGTVMAGIIAGDGSDSAGQAGGAHVGLAPEAWLVSVKVAGANGATDVSTVLAAMHWVAAYRDQYNIRVVNLSWGTKGTQSYKLDPLNYAVERLWNLGITVVVAAGNSGPGKSTITKPADDPFVITVGAYNDKQNTDPTDDAMAAWSSQGPTAADGLTKPDVVAPGRWIVSSRSYGSTVEKEYPKALLGTSYIRGSGSSQAAAATSGAAALLIRQKPNLAPDQVKSLLVKTAKKLPDGDANSQGAGRIDIAAAAASTDTSHANSTVTPSSGLGSIEASRGGAHVEVDCDGDGDKDVIQGEMTVQCKPWNAGTWSAGTWSGDAWTGGTWSGGTWSGGTWSAGTWSAGTWSGGTWSGGTWSGGTWSGGTWSAGTWSAGTWSAATWSGGTWSGGTWSGGTWSAGTWSGGTWSGGTWSGANWTTGTYDEFTTAGYDDFQTAFWGNSPPPTRPLPGEGAFRAVRPTPY